MYLRHIPAPPARAVSSNTADPLRRFISENLDGLTNAASLLAGARGSRLVTNIFDRLRADARISRSTWLALRDLLGILTLEHVHDPDRSEAAFFASIDPADPIVEEICLLTDGLRDALEEALERQPEVAHLLKVA